MQELGGDMANTADPIDQRDIPHHVVPYSQIKTRVAWLAGAALPRERHSFAGGEHLGVFASFAFLGFVSFLFFFFRSF